MTFFEHGSPSLKHLEPAFVPAFPLVRPCIDCECFEIQAFEMYYFTTYGGGATRFGYMCFDWSVCVSMSVFKTLKLSRPKQNG